MSIYVPRGVGRDALGELHHVSWGDLEHAYGTGIGKSLHENVRESLRLLGDDLDEAVNLLFGNVCHQGTIYESSAYAFPFIAAWAVGAEPSEESEDAIFNLLARIAFAATFDAPHGSHAGSFGAAVSAATKQAIKASERHLRVIGSRTTRLASLVDALLPELDATKLRALLGVA